MSALPPLLDRLYARAPRGIELGLHRVKAACNQLGHPERRWQIVHVAGTNGKGSVSAVCSLAMQRAGYRVGLFTSPHLNRFAERIRIDQEPIDDALLEYALSRALSFDPALTFFEAAFVASLVAFDRANVDCVVLEVGMGGRLDATNVIESPAATAVTRIALDHTASLGDTLEAIAFEKASIAKAGAPMVVGIMPPVAREAVVRTARQRGALPVVVLGEDTRVAREVGQVSVDLPWGTTQLRPRLAGGHQLDNAALAAALCCAASSRLPKLARHHVEAAASAVSWPGRLESFTLGDAEVLVDGAHNLDGTEACVAHLSSLRRAPEATSLVFGAMQDKAWQAMLRHLAPFARHRFYVTPTGRAPAPIDEMPKIASGQTCGTVQDALRLAHEAAGAHGLIVVCGSIFLAAEARAWLLGLDTDPLVAL